MNRRRALGALVALLVPAAGCSSPDSGGGAESPSGTPMPTSTETETETASPTPTRTRTAATSRTPTPSTTASPTPTETVPDPGALDDEPDYDHVLRVRNEATGPRTVAVTVTHRDTGRVVHEGTYDLDAGAEVAAFEFSGLADDYEGVQSFEIRARSGGRTASAVFRTSRCHALPEAVVSEEELSVVYAVC